MEHLIKARTLPVSGLMLKEVATIEGSSPTAEVIKAMKGLTF